MNALGAKNHAALSIRIVSQTISKGHYFVTRRINLTLVYMILAGLLSTLSLSTNAATKYVRPVSGGPYGSGDGSSYNDAFSGFSKVMISSGDTLYVCGSFTSLDARQSWVLYEISPSVSGIAGSPTIIDGDCSSRGDRSRATINAASRQYGIYVLQPASHIHLRNLEVYGVQAPVGQNTFPVRLCTAGTGNQCSFIVLDNMRIHDPVDPGGLNEATGVWGACDDCLIQNNEIFNIPSDGIWLSSAKRTVIRSNHIYNVATSGRNTGDNIQLQGADDLILEGNTLDHSSSEAKQVLVIHSGSRIRVSGNTMIMSTARDQASGNSKVLQIQSPGAIVDANYIVGGWGGLWVAGGGTKISNNILTGAYGIHVSAYDVSDYDFYNNLVDCRGLPGAIGFENSGSGYVRNLVNNIFVRCGYAVRKGGVGTLNFTSNLMHQNIDNDTWFSMNGSNRIADPLFTNMTGSYSRPSDYITSVTSPVVDSGTPVPFTRDFLGKEPDSAIDIGPFQIDSSVPAVSNFRIIP